MKMSAQHKATTAITIVTLLSFFILSIGCGRILSLVQHTPMLAYANNYEMIPLQACQQIWPADPKIDITRGTVSAPLRDYTLDKHVDTPCIFSSELLFSHIAIALARILHPDNHGISLQSIGLVKALALILTATLAQVAFFRLGNVAAQLAHAFIILGVLSDPAITLYLSTFYTEFSAVYFLYLTSIGSSFFVLLRKQENPATPWQWLLAATVTVAGIIGLGLSKSLHTPLLVIMGSLLCLQALCCKPRLLIVPIAFAVATPFALQQSLHITLSNDNMVLASKINTVASAIETSDDPASLLSALGLPDSCLALKGKNWYAPAIQKNKVCFELRTISQIQLAMRLSSQPRLLSDMTKAGIPRLKEWILFQYGQVEGETLGKVNNYFWTATGWFKQLGDNTLMTLLLFPPALSAFGMIVGKLSRNRVAIPLASTSGLLFSLLPITILLESLFQGGLIDFPKHVHLLPPVLASLYLVIAAKLLSLAITRVCAQ